MIEIQKEEIRKVMEQLQKSYSFIDPDSDPDYSSYESMISTAYKNKNINYWLEYEKAQEKALKSYIEPTQNALFPDLRYGGEFDEIVWRADTSLFIPEINNCRIKSIKGNIKIGKISNSFIGIINCKIIEKIIDRNTIKGIFNCSIGEIDGLITINQLMECLVDWIYTCDCISEASRTNIINFSSGTIDRLVDTSNVINFREGPNCLIKFISPDSAILRKNGKLIYQQPSQEPPTQQKRKIAYKF